MCNTGLIVNIDFTSTEELTVPGPLYVAGVKEGDYILLAWLQGDEEKTTWFSKPVTTDDYVDVKISRQFTSNELFTLVIARTL